MATFTEDFTRMRNDFDEAQAARQRLFEETRHGVAQMAQGVQEQLAGFRTGLGRMRGEIAETADQLRHRLGQFRSDLHAGGRIFRK